MNKLWRCLWVLKYRLAFLKILSKSDASGYYTLIGDDVLETCNEHFTNPDKPLWLNMGYWKHAKTYPEACVDMVKLLGDTADLKPEDNVLDVGFGFGEQDFVFIEHFNVSHITGINITPLHVEVAQKKAKEKHLEGRIDFRLGNATDSVFKAGQFDKVLALECAFHFRTRETFFQEAFRVLKSGGRLATMDMLPAPGENFNTFFKWWGRREACNPEENMYDRTVYEQKLKNAGFINVNVQSIVEYVYPHQAKYMEKRLKEKCAMEKIIVELTEEEFRTRKGVENWAKAYGMSDYIIASADKP